MASRVGPHGRAWSRLSAVVALVSAVWFGGCVETEAEEPPAGPSSTSTQQAARATTLADAPASLRAATIAVQADASIEDGLEEAGDEADAFIGELSAQGLAVEAGT